MRSMRSELLLRLFAGLACAFIVVGLLVYRHMRIEIDELYNTNLQQLAILLARQLGNVEGGDPVFFINDDEHRPTWEEENYLIQLWDGAGQLRYAHGLGANAPEVPLLAQPGFFHRRIAGQSWRVFRADGNGLSVQIAQPEAARRIIITETSLYLLLPLTLLIPLMAVLSWAAVRRGLQPLNRLSSAIAQRQPHALTPFDETSLPSDLQPFVRTLNALLERLQRALQQQRNFTADAAHELRTPIAALQLQLDLLRRAETEQDRQLSMDALQGGILRATRLIEQLLRIARAEAAPTNAAATAVMLPELGATVLERHLPAARARCIDLGVTRIQAVAVQVPRGDLETVLDNLVGNAIAYTPASGKIDLALFCEDDRFIIEVSDTGIGIPEHERARIFDRFYRVLSVDASAPEVTGTGLGLAIVKSICERHGAEITVAAGADGNGTRFTISWPQPAT